VSGVRVKDYWGNQIAIAILANNSLDLHPEVGLFKNFETSN